MDLIEFLFDLVTSVLWSGRRKNPPRDVNQRAPSNASTPERLIAPRGRNRSILRAGCIRAFGRKWGKKGKLVGDDARGARRRTFTGSGETPCCATTKSLSKHALNNARRAERGTYRNRIMIVPST